MSRMRLFLFMQPIVIRCRNKNKIHNKKFDPDEDKGKILVVLEGNSIFAKCSGGKHNCKRWTKIELPGVDKNFFENAPLKQSIMPFNFKFPLEGDDIKQAPVLIED